MNCIVHVALCAGGICQLLDVSTQARVIISARDQLRVDTAICSFVCSWHPHCDGATGKEPLLQGGIVQ